MPPSKADKVNKVLKYWVCGPPKQLKRAHDGYPVIHKNCWFQDERKNIYLFFYKKCWSLTTIIFLCQNLKIAPLIQCLRSFEDIHQKSKIDLNLNQVFCITFLKTITHLFLCFRRIDLTKYMYESKWQRYVINQYNAVIK